MTHCTWHPRSFTVRINPRYNKREVIEIERRKWELSRLQRNLDYIMTRVCRNVSVISWVHILVKSNEIFVWNLMLFRVQVVWLWRLGFWRGTVWYMATNVWDEPTVSILRSVHKLLSTRFLFAFDRKNIDSFVVMGAPDATNFITKLIPPPSPAIQCNAIWWW